MVTSVGIASFIGVAASTATAVAAAAINGAIIGAVVGAAMSAVTGGNVLQGMLYGAIGGAVMGGIAGYLNPGAVGAAAASGEATTMTVGEQLSTGAGEMITGVGQSMPSSMSAGITGGEMAGANMGEVAANTAQSMANAGAKSGGLLDSVMEIGNSQLGQSVLSGAGKMFDAHERRKELADNRAWQAEQSKLEHERAMERLKLQAALGGGGGGGGGTDMLALERLKHKNQKELLAMEKADREAQRNRRAATLRSFGEGLKPSTPGSQPPPEGGESFEQILADKESAAQKKQAIA